MVGARVAWFLSKLSYFHDISTQEYFINGYGIFLLGIILQWSNIPSRGGRNLKEGTYFWSPANEFI